MHHEMSSRSVHVGMMVQSRYGAARTTSANAISVGRIADPFSEDMHTLYLGYENSLTGLGRFLVTPDMDADNLASLEGNA